jgi:hypothetical protein
VLRTEKKSEPGDNEGTLFVQWPGPINMERNELTGKSWQGHLEEKQGLRTVEILGM